MFGGVPAAVRGCCVRGKKLLQDVCCWWGCFAKSASTFVLALALHPITDDVLENLASGGAIRDGFVTESNTVEDNVFCECEEVIRCDIGSSVDECASAGGFDE